jgi:phosphoenolpyruvate phosphomutase
VKAKANLLRELLARGRPAKVIGAHDGLSARIGERSGFDAIWASGLEISVAHAVPDAGILSMSDFLTAAVNMNDSTTLPIVCDCDTGYGNSNNVIHLVRKFEAAGIAAVCMEDKLFPKVNSFIPGRQELADPAEFVGKIMAAKNAQIHDDFVVIARVEALIAGWGLTEAKLRAHAYADAGADMILMHSKRSDPSEIVKFCKSWKRKTPIVLVPTTYATLSYKKIAALGNVGLVIYANHGIRAAVAAMESVMTEVCKKGSTLSVHSRIATLATLFELQGMPRFKADEARFGTQKSRDQAVVLAAGRHDYGKQFRLLLKNNPIVNLDVNGQTLLERNLKELRDAGVGVVTVVGGFQGEKIAADGTKLVLNKNWDGSGNLGSFALGLESAKARTIVCYGDVVLDSVLARQALGQKQDVCLIVDRTAVTGNSARDKQHDWVRTAKPSGKKRDLTYAAQQRVVEIGKTLSPKGDDIYEFTGILVLSPKGVTIVKKHLAAAKKSYARKKFFGSKNFSAGTLNDFINYLVSKKVRVTAWETASGWSEIHDFSDYQAVCKQVAESDG